MVAAAAGQRLDMALLFRLPLMLFELLLRRLFGRDDDWRAEPIVTTDEPAAPVPVPDVPAPGRGAFTGASANGAPAPPTVEEAIERTLEREAEQAAAPDPAPPAPMRPIGGVAAEGHVDREAELVESFGPADDVGDVGGTITVDAPWPEYDHQPASAIINRLRGADGATKAVVALYERANKGRKSVLKAAG